MVKIRMKKNPKFLPPMLAILISIMLLSGCTEIEQSFDDVKDTLADTYERGKEYFEGMSIDDERLIHAISNLEPIDGTTMNSYNQYKSTADSVNLAVEILNREGGLDIDKLDKTTDEHSKISKTATKYTPLLGNYNSLVYAAKDFQNGNGSKIDFYRAVAELSIEIIVIQAGVFYKPAFKITGAIFRNTGLSKLAFRFPSLISHMMSCVHWYLRNWMVDETSELAGGLIQELEDLSNAVNEEAR